MKKILVDFAGMFVPYMKVREKDFKNDLPGNFKDIKRGMLDKFEEYEGKFGGKLILCFDSRPYWREKDFKEYKWARRNKKETIDYDKEEYKRLYDNYIKHLKGNYPYIDVDGAEGDDIIGTVCMYETFCNKTNDINTIVIVSGDKDFFQLHNENVRQYVDFGNSKNKGFISGEYGHNNKVEAMKLVLLGDLSDGVPNIFSPDNYYSTKQRMKIQNFSKNLIANIVESSDYNSSLERSIRRKISTLSITYDQVMVNYKRNKKMIDLRETPREIQEEIISQFIEVCSCN